MPACVNLMARVAALVLLPLGVGELAAEVPDNRQIRKEVYTGSLSQFRTRTEKFSVVVDGKPVQKTREIGYVVRVPRSLLRTVIPGLEWSGILDHPATQRELKLSDEQTESIELLLNDVDALKADLPVDAQRVFARVDELTARLDQLLTESQRKRFDEAVYRRHLTAAKIAALVDPEKKKQLAKKKEQLAKNKRAAAKRKAKQGDRFWGGATKDSDWYEELTAPLTVVQRQQISDYLGAGFLKCYRQFRPLVVAQLYHQPRRKLEDREFSIQTFGYDVSGLSAPDCFDNSLGYYRLRYDSAADARVYGPYFELLYFAGNNIPGLSDNQEAKLRDVTRDHEQMRWGNEPDFLILDTTKRLLGILTESQRRHLEERCILIGVKRRGVYASLMHGELRRRLSVSDEQRNQIEAITTKLRSRIVKNEMDRKEQSYEEALALLDDEKRQMVRKRMGAPIQWWP